MVGVFKQKTPVNILLVFVAGFLLKLPVFTAAHVPLTSDTDSPLYHWIAGGLVQKTSGQFIAALSYLLLFVQSMMLNRFVNDYRMLPRYNYLPAISYMLITSLLPEWNYFSAALLTNTFLLLVFYILFRMYNQQRVRAMVFNIGLALGLSSFLFSSSLVFIIWALPGILVMRPVKINEWMICLIGLLTPYYLYLAYMLIAGPWNPKAILPSVSFHIPHLQPSFWLAGSALLLVVPFLAGGYFIQINLRRMLIQVRKNWSLVLIYLLVAMIVPFLSGGLQFENWIVCVIPFAAFHACGYFFPKKLVFPLLIFWLTVAFILTSQYYAKNWVI